MDPREDSSKEIVFYGSTSDAYDIRYSDDCHETYGKQYDAEEDGDDT